MKIVVALGGNALGKTLNEQMQAVKVTARAVADLIEEGHDVALTHGNGPQVGHIDRAMSALCHEDREVEHTPLSMCVAMSQAYIGYDLQNALREELTARGIHKPVATVVTQVLVDADDPAMSHPTKPIGKFMSEHEALLLRARSGYQVAEDAGRGWRRVVPSPKPRKIVELDAIRASILDGSAVICCGGGGIPVKRVGNFLKGVSAVIDKDYASALLADSIGADMLLILTAVEKVAVHFRQKDERALDRMSVDQARAYIESGEFAPGSMLEKVQAAVEFVTGHSERAAVITDLVTASRAVCGETGTRLYQP